jgi:amidase
MNDICALGAAELAHHIRSGRLSSTAVVEAHLQGIEAVDPVLHAVVARSATARDEARAADARVARGEPLGPLHGVPVSIKDWIEVAGMPCVADLPERIGYLPQRDATVVARLRAAGAIVLAKTKTGEGEAVHPRPRNPFDPDRTAGASSGGEAALVAARGAPLGIGSDSGGSIRWPAHCCGVFGLKPTGGLVPLTGHFPRITALQDPRTVIGPLARHVADLELALSVLAGPDGVDASVVPVPLRPSATVAIDTLRVAVFDRFGSVVPDPAVAAALHAVREVLVPLVGRVSEAVPPRITEARAITEAYWARPASASLSEWRPVGAFRLSGEQVERSLFEWDRLRRAMTAFLNPFDVVVCPAAPRAAPVLTELDDYAYTLPFSLTGNPVVTVPVTRDAAGLPVAVQVVARCFEDHVALALAAVLERAFEQPVPVLALG